LTLNAGDGYRKPVTINECLPNESLCLAKCASISPRLGNAAAKPDGELTRQQAKLLVSIGEASSQKRRQADPLNVIE
jgi:hypothetical protein